MPNAAGLESTLDWYIPTVGRQAGIEMHYEKNRGRARTKKWTLSSIRIVG